MVLKGCTGIFNVWNVWTNIWNNLKKMKKRNGLRGRIPRKVSNRKSMPAVWIRVFCGFGSHCLPVFKGKKLKMASQTRKIQS